MPAIITHYIFGLETAESISSSPLYSVLKDNYTLYGLGLQGPDPIYYHHIYKKDAKKSVAFKLHTEKTADYIISLLCYAKKFPVSSESWNEILSFTCGVICHYVLDYMSHPYIYYFSGKYTPSMPETKKYRGLHHKLELTIDNILCSEKPALKKSKITPSSLLPSNVPSNILAALDETILLNYGIPNGGQIYMNGCKNMRNYYYLGKSSSDNKIKQAILTIPGVSNIMGPVANSISLVGSSHTSIDYLNRKRRVWRHPVTGNISTASFDDILRNSLKKSSYLLLVAYKFASTAMTAEELRDLIPNVSYITGLPLDDTRPFKYFSE